VDALTWFGLVTLTAMLLCYAFETRSHWLILGFAVEAIWAAVAARRWHVARVRR